MKTFHVPGEFAFKALYRTLPKLAWELTDGYFFNQKEASNYIEEKKAFGYIEYEVIWPVEELDNGAVYVPAQEEME